MTKKNIFDAADYILEKCGPMTNMKLQKLLYYAQAWSLVWDGQELFPEEFEAWATGPMSPALESCYEIPKALLSSKPFADAQFETLDAVIRDYGDKDADWLIELTRIEDPWREAREGYLPGEYCHQVISKESMKSYYARLQTEYNSKSQTGSREESKLKGIRFEFTKDALVEIKALGLPKRSTTYSAGYDFVSPQTVTINPGEAVKLPTYIKAHMPEGVVLKLYVRSSIGIKRNLVLSNGTGIIDGDYADNPDNDGNIIGALFNMGSEPQTIQKGERFMQGIFCPFYITENDDASGMRTGGIGSTSD